MTRSAIVGTLWIRVTEDCAGSAQCVALAPAVFELVGGQASIRPDLRIADASSAAEAADVCPMGAIVVAADSA